MVFYVHEAESIFLVKGNSLQICVNSQESASSLVLEYKHRLDVIQDRCTYLLTFGRFINAQTAQFYRRIAFQAFFIGESLLFAKTVKLLFILEVSDGHFVICQTTISQHAPCFGVSTGITHG